MGMCINMAHNFESVQLQNGSLHNFSSSPTAAPEPTLEQQKNIDEVVQYIVENHSLPDLTVREHVCRMFLDNWDKFWILNFELFFIYYFINALCHVFAVKPVVALISRTFVHEIRTLARPNTFWATHHLVRFADGRDGWNTETLVAAIFTMCCFGLFKLFHGLFGPQLFDNMALRPTTLFFRRKLFDPLGIFGTCFRVGLGHVVVLLGSPRNSFKIYLIHWHPSLHDIYLIH